MADEDYLKAGSKLPSTQDPNTIKGMSISRRHFLATGIGLTGAGSVNPRSVLCGGEMALDPAFIKRHRSRIEQAIVSAMEAVYLPYEETFDENYQPELKYIEKVVSFYDYQATGISVLAGLARQEAPRIRASLRRSKKTSSITKRIYSGPMSEASGARDLGGSAAKAPAASGLGLPEA